jgi:hypothetical protein
MADIELLTTAQSPEARAARRAFGLRAHEIENNPLDAEQIALFEQFDRDGLSDEQRRAVLIARAKMAAG